jgi:queuine tRNA-ribosyltransferase
MHPGFKFTLHHRLGHARAGSLMTPHGLVETPVFMPVGTKASVKSLDAADLISLDAPIILANTYHLYLKPGESIIESVGGLHDFMKWPRPILTDSGGYQVSSLGLFKNSGQSLSSVDDDGVTFFSHHDGSEHRMTAESSIQIQAKLGADIIMAFDEATPDRGKAYAKKAMERTHRWLIRSRDRWQQLEADKVGQGSGKPPQALFGIIQGGIYRDLRRQSAGFVAGLNLPGIALGGASIGQNPEETEENASWVRDLLPKEKPIYFMGVGVGPDHAISAILSGADMFDCIAPSKLARNGLLYHGQLVIGPAGIETARFESDYLKKRINIAKKEFSRDKSPILESCGCYTCTHGYSRAYLHHLFRSRELAYYRLATIHNLYTMVNLVSTIRQEILKAAA